MTIRVAVAMAGVLVIAGAWMNPPSAALPRENPTPIPMPATAATPTPGSTEIPAVQLPPAILDGHGLTPAMEAAVKKMRAAAAKEWVEVEVDEGYVTPARQNARYQAAVKKYGARATKVSRPAWDSAHVRGEAIDIGPTEWAVAWVYANQDKFGICRVSTDAPAHFELRPVGQKKCAAPTAKGSEDG